MQGQGGFEVELHQLGAAIIDFQARQDVEAEHEGLGFGAAMGLDVADDHIHAFLAGLATGFEHGVGFSDAGGGPEEYFQLAAGPFGLFGLDASEQGIRIGALFGHF